MLCCVVSMWVGEGSREKRDRNPLWARIFMGFIGWKSRVSQK